MNRHSHHESSESSYSSDQYQKEVWPGSTLLAPVPIVMVTTQTPGGKPNICTVAWAGIVCSNPPMLSISLQPSRHSFSHLMEQKEFVVNIPPRHLARETDMCGVISGRDEDKFEKTHLTPVPAKDVLPPLIRECPVNLECRVTKVIELGSHHLFIAEIVRVHVQKKLINETGRLAIEKARLLSYAHGHYYAIGIRIGRYGFSVRKHHPEENAPARKEKKMKKKLEREASRAHDRPREARHDRYEEDAEHEERRPRRFERDDRGPREHRESRPHGHRGHDRPPRREGGVWNTEPVERPRSDEGRDQGEDRPRRPRHHDDRTQGHDRPRRPRHHDDRPQGDDRPRRPRPHDDQARGDDRPRRPRHHDDRPQGDDRPRRPRPHDDQARGDDRPRRPRHHDDRPQGDDRPRRPRPHDEQSQSDARPRRDSGDRPRHHDRGEHSGRDRARERLREKVGDRVRRRESR
ncbi:MAG TPA: flavin reductase [Candidatus Ozemobacteraceae bacterium]|nr:flavin reductase [Candidatus Ozemobacteraceae bacterium]